MVRDLSGVTGDFLPVVTPNSQRSRTSVMGHWKVQGQKKLYVCGNFTVFILPQGTSVHEYLL